MLPGITLYLQQYSCLILSNLVLQVFTNTHGTHGNT